VSVLCLVPTPTRAARVARRLCDAEGGLLFGPRVLTPGDLVPGILAAAGERRPLLTPLAARILALAASQAAGDPFGHPEPASGLARALAGTVEELCRAELSADHLEAAGRLLAGPPGERLTRMAAVLRAYQARLIALSVLDEAEGLRLAAHAVRDGASPESIGGLDLLVLDGFHDPSRAEWDLLAALVGRARRTLARAPYFPERPDLSRAAEPFLRGVESLHADAVERNLEVSLAPLEEARAPRLAALLRSLAGGPGPAPGIGDGGRIEAFAGAGEEGEAEAVARIAGEWMASGGRPEDLAILAPAPTRAAPLLAAAFRVRGVPLSTGRGVPVNQVPVVRTIREALAAACRFTRSGAERLAASSYLSVGPSPSRLARWLDRSGALDGRNDPAGALAQRAQLLAAPKAAPERAELSRAAAALRRMQEALAPLGSSGTAREHAARLAGFLSTAGVRRRAARAEPEQAHRDLAALARLEELSERLAQAMALAGRGDERIHPEEQLAWLDAALEGATTPATGEPAGGAAELWALSEAPGLRARAAILVGCTRGSWPPAPRTEPILRDPERAAVNDLLRRGALPVGSARRSQAIYLAASAMAVAEEALFFTWPASGPGRSSGPLAPLAAEALSLCGVPVPDGPGGDPSLSAARTQAEALRAGARLYRAGAGERAIKALRSASPELAARAASAFARAELEAERLAAVEQRVATPGAGLIPAALAGQLARALPAEWTPTQLEHFANCPYQLFLDLLLHLPDREAAGLDIDPRDEGSLTHAVLERFVQARSKRNAWPLTGTDEEKREARQVAEALFEKFEAQGRVGDPAVWAARRASVLNRLDRFVACEADEVAKAGPLRPTLLEYGFGGKSGVPPLVFEAGAGEEPVRVQGRLDRVDASAQELLVIDYKNGRNRQDLKAKLQDAELAVTNFQVPIYLMAAARALPGRTTLSATYAMIRAAERIEPRPLESGHPLFATDPARRAEIRAQGGQTLADAVVSTVAQIRQGRFPIASRDCTHCGYGAVCRFQSDAEGEP
jgi:ATP-dependent helicase/DNAse subunit B